MPSRLTLDQARRLFLAGQGLLASPTRRAGPAELQRTIEGLGFVQIDSINVVERAHHLTLHSRLHGYQRDWLDRLLAQKRLFEHWTHDASLIPTAFYAHWHHRFERYRVRVQRHRWWRERLGDDSHDTIAHVLERITQEGPLRSRDFANERGPSAGWWEWKGTKAALEFLWRTGRLAVSSRERFEKVYDLSERVLPQAVRQSVPTRAEHVEWACRQALLRLGTAGPAELAAYWNTVDLDEARQWCRTHAHPVRVDGRAAFALPETLDGLSSLPTPPPAIRLLAPFDPILRDRARTLRLFGFDYRFEAFVPAPKRVYGYYVLPILEGDRLVGRTDLKFHRQTAHLEVRGLWWEAQIKAGVTRTRRLQRALEGLAAFLGAASVGKGQGPGPVDARVGGDRHPDRGPS